MKILKILTYIVVHFSLVSINYATELNGRINILNNDGANYKVILQIKTSAEPQELGGTTIVLSYDNSELSFPDDPQKGIDFIFYNFNQGYYDEANITKVTAKEIWINIDLISDEHGTLVSGNSNQWTDLVLLNFESDHVITGNAILWDIYNSYWGVYGSDNLTMWEIGNFDNITTSFENEINNDQLNTFILEQNYPNPFNPITNIEYRIPDRSFVTIKVFNIIGDEILSLVNEEKQAGIYSVRFDGTSLASGMYLYRMQAGTFIETKKMMLIK